MPVMLGFDNGLKMGLKEYIRGTGCFGLGGNAVVVQISVILRDSSLVCGFDHVTDW